jgi:hypothetical protein
LTECYGVGGSAVVEVEAANPGYAERSRR